MRLPLFAFGTLRDSDVLEAVLERPASEVDRLPALLRDHRVAKLPDESYPVLIRSPGEQAEGLLLRGLSDRDFHRIDFFENSEYQLERCRVELADARCVDAVYCSEGTTASGPREPWSLEHWQRTEKAQFIQVVRRYMQLFGSLSAEEADSQWIKWTSQ